MQANTELVQVCGQMLICGICNKKIKQPKYLPCHHSFCFECVVDTLNSNQQKITCSECQAKHSLSFEQMNILADDTMKSNLIIPFMNEKLKLQKTKCDVCDDDEEAGVSACVDCEIFLCDLHQKAHFKAKETKTHQIIMHATNPYVVGNNHNAQSSDALRSMKAQPRPTNYSSAGSSPSNGRLLLESPTGDMSSTTPPYKRRLEDADADETPKKRGRKAVHDQKWDQNFDLLKAMKTQTGNFNFIRENPALQGWVQYMKSSYKRGKLAPDRVEALEQIGFAWTTEKLQVRWDQRLDQLRQYKELHGNCNVPSTAKGDYSGLGQWLASTRMKKRKGHLSEGKTRDLEEIGVEWSLKRTTKATSQSTNADEYDEYDDDGGSNNNDNNDNNEYDDYDEDDVDTPTNNTGNPNTNSATTSPTNSAHHNLKLISYDNNTNNNNTNNNNNNTNNIIPNPTPNVTSSSYPREGTVSPTNFNYNQPPRPFPPLQSNLNTTPANQMNNAKLLDFLNGSIADVTIKKDKVTPQ